MLRSWSWMVLWRPIRPFRTNTPKRCPFHYRGLECRSRRSTGKFGLGVQNEAGQRLIEFCQENALVIANTLFQQHKRRLHMDITRWSTPKSDILCSRRWRSSIQSAKTRLGADCGSDHELLIAKFSPLNCKEIQPVHPKGDKSWVFVERTDVEAETPVL